MGLRYRLYWGLQWLLGVGATFAAAFLFAGWGQAVFPDVELVGQPMLAGSLAAGVAVGSWYVFGRLRIRRWYAIGTQAGLTPDGSSTVVSRVGTIVSGPRAVSPLPDLTGTVHGRTVRAKTYAVSEGSPETGSNSENFTVVEAELDGPTGMSAVLAPRAAGAATALDVLPGGLDMVTVDDEFSMVGDSSVAHAEEVLSARAREALLDLPAPVALYVGDPTDAVVSALPDEMGMVMSFAAGALEERLREYPAFDADTVSTNNAGLLLDADELERQAEAVAAVAEAVERVDVAASGQ